MKSLKWLFWSVLFFVMLLAVDQLFLQVPPLHPVHGAISQFYKDLRGRMIAQATGDAIAPPSDQPAKPAGTPESIEAVIDREEDAIQATKPAPSTGPRYVYPDDSGALQFADRLEDIPPAYRSLAQRMSTE